MTRTNSIGALVGAVVGLACTVCFQRAGGNEFFFSIVGLVPTLVVGYLVSLVTGRPRPEQVQELTAWGKRKSG